MKKTRRMILTGLALALCLALAVSALAEGTLGTLYRTATALLFDTDNVTLNAHATFAYEGELFKTLDGQCVQSGTDSKLTLMLKTPKKDGSIYEGGYTVIANSGTAYSMETANPQIYSANTCKNSASLLSSTVLRRTILSLGSAIADVCEGSLGQKIAVQPLAEGGAQYHLQLAEGDTPQLINAAGTLLAQAAAKRFFYFDYGEVDSLGGPDEDQTGCDVYFEDYDVNFAAAYLAEFGEEFPEDFYDRLWQDDGKLDMSLYERYEKIVDALSLQTSDLQKQYPSGVAMIRTDGSAVHFDTMDAYMIAAGQQEIVYDALDTMFLQYYREKTGAELTMTELHAIEQSGNSELWDSYYEMFDVFYNELDDRYDQILKADGAHAMLVVAADGSYRLIDSVRDYWRSFDGQTVTWRILGEMEKLELADADVTVTTDAQGRFTAASGTVRLLVVNGSGEKKPLEIAFETSAEGYGSSEVEQFDPAKYGVMSWEEYYSAVERGEIEPAVYSYYDFDQLPKTVIFNGVEYDTMLEDGSQNG